MIIVVLSFFRMVASRREALWEVYGQILGLHCNATCGSFGLLRDAVLRGLRDFPANMTLLGILCDIEVPYSNLILMFCLYSKILNGHSCSPSQRERDEIEAFQLPCRG